MATLAEWVGGARPRTLPAALSPVLAGSAVAWFVNAYSPVLSVLALIVSLSLQVGVNFANDYSDGIRGTDADRVGPLRLVGSGAADPRTVRNAAFVCFGVAAVTGLAIVILTGFWWLLIVGVLCIAAAWYYTGGRRPYGYRGLGEVFVFVFFGIVAVAGTAYIQVGSVPASGWWAAVAIGSLACLILVANNLRDLGGDHSAGKRTLATRLGDRCTRVFFGLLIVIAGMSVLGVAATSSAWALLGLVMLGVLAHPALAVARGANGPELIPVLQNTGLAEFVCALGLTVGLLVGV